MNVQPYVSSEEGILFDVSFNIGNISFRIIELTKSEILTLLKDVVNQVELLEDSYQEQKKEVI